MRRKAAEMAAASVLAAGLGAGCASYERKPLDETAHWDEFESRLARLLEHGPKAAGFGDRAPGAGDDGVEAGVLDVRDGVDAREAEVIAAMFNGEVRVARARAGVSLAGAGASGLWRDPMLSIDVMRMVDGGMNPWEVLAGIGIEIPLLGRLEAERALAWAMHDVEVSRVAQAEWEARVAVREAWVRWEAARQEQRALDVLVSGLEELVTTVEAMEAAGEATGLQAGMFRAELGERRARLAGASAEAEAAALQLVNLCGLAPAACEALVPGAGPEAREPGAYAAALDAARHGSPGLAIARAEYEAAERDLAMAVREGKPDVELMPGLGREEGESRVALGISMPLPLFNGNKRGVAESEGRRELARVMFEVEAEALAGELREAYAMWEGAQARAAVVRERLEPEAEGLERAALAVSRLGEVDVLMLLEALSRRQEAALMRIESERDEALARLRIEGLVGPRAEGDAR